MIGARVDKPTVIAGSSGHGIYAHAVLLVGNLWVGVDPSGNILPNRGCGIILKHTASLYVEPSRCIGVTWHHCL